MLARSHPLLNKTAALLAIALGIGGGSYGIASAAIGLERRDDGYAPRAAPAAPAAPPAPPPRIHGVTSAATRRCSPVTRSRG